MANQSADQINRLSRPGKLGEHGHKPDGDIIQTRWQTMQHIRRRNGQII